MEGNSKDMVDCNVSISQMSELICEHKPNELQKTKNIKTKKISSKRKRNEEHAILKQKKKKLDEEIEKVQHNIIELKSIFHEFVTHAATCPSCGSLKIRFE
ncbi:uncharacterized protein LOC130624277 [Hydractinia symbiolongicarpus]|uniref:uncharacterized protein LOC130624277 n=1 Tax=Hydractinia symbiolongicarpus TaxID=13093 RepID=UPI002551102A|nr:uncharacterized protein LOC130624277 [Hydractinia symbiolongicarpus]